MANFQLPWSYTISFLTSIILSKKIPGNQFLNLKIRICKTSFSMGEFVLEWVDARKVKSSRIGRVGVTSSLVKCPVGLTTSPWHLYEKPTWIINELFAHKYRENSLWDKYLTRVIFINGLTPQARHSLLNETYHPLHFLFRLGPSEFRVCTQLCWTNNDGPLVKAR